MKILVKSHAPSQGFGYGAGVHQVADNLAKKMIKAGVADSMEPKKAPAKVNKPKQK